jgi:hypothetical protein
MAGFPPKIELRAACTSRSALLTGVHAGEQCLYPKKGTSAEQLDFGPKDRKWGWVGLVGGGLHTEDNQLEYYFNGERLGCYFGVEVRRRDTLRQGRVGARMMLIGTRQ